MSSGGRRTPPGDLHRRRPLSPLKLRRDSQKIKKPPVAPPPPPPVIIYSVSPEVIHTSPSDFMGLVQRLTGPDPPARHSESAFVRCEKTEMPSEVKNYNNDGGWFGLPDSQPWPVPITDPSPVMNLHHQDHHQDCHWSPIQQPPPVVGGGGKESGDNNTSNFLSSPSTHSHDPFMAFPTSFALIGSLLDQ